MLFITGFLYNSTVKLQFSEFKQLENFNLNYVQNKTESNRVFEE